MKQLFQIFISFHTKHDFMKDTIRYTGVSEYFEKIPRSIRIPYYKMIVKDDYENRKRVFRFVNDKNRYESKNIEFDCNFSENK